MFIHIKMANIFLYGVLFFGWKIILSIVWVERWLFFLENLLLRVYRITEYLTT